MARNTEKEISVWTIDLFKNNVEPLQSFAISIVLDNPPIASIDKICTKFRYDIRKPLITPINKSMAALLEPLLGIYLNIERASAQLDLAGVSLAEEIKIALIREKSIVPSQHWYIEGYAKDESKALLVRVKLDRLPVDELKQIFPDFMWKSKAPIGRFYINTTKAKKLQYPLDMLIKAKVLDFYLAFYSEPKPLFA